MSGLLAFHAHPDDESISMGGTLAEYASRGVPVTVVTATRGEAGEIHNRDDADEVRSVLGDIREAEERAACRVLGIEDIEFLGYRDSGMMGTGDNAHADSFWGADFTEAVGRLVRVIRARRPQVVTAYDPFGGYGHPDHIQVHRVGTAAFFASADIGRYPLLPGEEPWQAPRLYWATWSRERMRRIRREMSTDLGADGEPEEPSSGTLPEHITTRRDVSVWLHLKQDALLCHDSQFAADSWIRTLPEGRMSEFLAEEVFVRAFSTVPGDPADPDLLVGLPASG
jgi:N-acetyl-1-D-myo-inositol-2-amino-2-deoxy-alpha-D-glucopyranoside deacetylase